MLCDILILRLLQYLTIFIVVGGEVKYGVIKNKYSLCQWLGQEQTNKKFIDWFVC